MKLKLKLKLDRNITGINITYSPGKKLLGHSTERQAVSHKFVQLVTNLVSQSYILQYTPEYYYYTRLTAFFPGLPR